MDSKWDTVTSHGWLERVLQPIYRASYQPERLNEWTIGAIYYSTMIVAETLGKTGTAQLLDPRRFL
ncbi:hypothetical protein C8J56DRAFT_1054991 [Mycena floridula]|nr:hypothetical protein C8J56DRAFT_1054991 [Mycena floridula]